MTAEVKRLCPRVAYWYDMPMPYVVERFAALHARGNVQFEGWFTNRTEPDRSWEIDEESWGFRGRYISGERIAGQRLHLPSRELREFEPDVLISLFSSASFSLGSMMARAAGTRIVWRIVPTWDSWFERKRWREASKHILFRGVDGAKVPGPMGAGVASRYGVPRDRIFPVTQSIDIAHYAKASSISPQDRRRGREAHGLSGCVFLFVGRLLSNKGLDFLFDAFEAVQAQEPDVSLLLVGDGVHEERYRARAEGLERVRFTGFRQVKDLPDVYALADVFVFPTLGEVHGLVLDEAIAAGLPVITTNAVGDVDIRFRNGDNAFVTPVAESTQLAERMLSLARDAALRSRLAKRAVSSLDNPHERWAEGVERLVERVLEMPRRRSVSAYGFTAAGRLLRYIAPTS